MLSLTRCKFPNVSALAVLAVMFAASCAPPPAPEGVNVVIVLVDQLRKDTADEHLVHTNRLAESGIRFEQMRSTAPWTYPSVISFLSGLYPQQHGADRHLMKDELFAFSNELPLLQNVLQDRGYFTSAFITNPFLLEWNPFNEGFNHFESQFINSQGNQVGHDDKVWTTEMYADAVNRAVFAHYQELPHRKPEFTYVHYIDVHGPWDDAPFQQNYFAATRFVDERIVELYDHFNQRYQGNMLFFVTSDHGRSLDNDEHVGEDAAWRRNKQSVHDFNLRIPFLILPSNHTPKPRVVGVSCSNVDFMPTILQWLNIPSTIPLVGKSLLPAIRGKRWQHGRRAIYAKNSAFQILTDAMVYDGKKYMRYFRNETESIHSAASFDLKADPRELSPTLQTRRGKDFSGNIKTMIDQLAGDHGLQFSTRQDSVAGDLRKQLRTLGYIR